MNIIVDSRPTSKTATAIFSKLPEDRLEIGLDSEFAALV
jgi:hypothetical protein